MTITVGIMIAIAIAITVGIMIAIATTLVFPIMDLTTPTYNTANRGAATRCGVVFENCSFSVVHAK